MPLSYAFTSVLHYVFPGIALGTIASQSLLLTDEMFYPSYA